MDKKPPIEPVLRALAAKARRTLDDHPTPEELVAYRAGELTAEDEERIRDHLALCRDCSQLLLDLKEFEDAAPEEEAGLSDIQVEAAWRRLRPRLEERKVLTSPRWFASPRFAYGLAAGLFLCTVGLSVWGLSLQQKVRELSEPLPNAPIGDLHAEGGGAVRGGPGEPEILRSRPGGVLVLDFDPRDFRRFDVELRKDGKGGELLWSGGGLVESEEGSYTLGLPRSGFQPGLYWIDLYGVDGGRREWVAGLAFRLDA